jgi:hypothetical protein
MPATPRDLLKPQTWRAAEVNYLSALKAGQANGQYVEYGCQFSSYSTPAALNLSAGRIFIGGVVVEVPAQTNIAVPPGADTSSGQYMKVLIEIAADGSTLTFTPGTIAGSAAAAALPALTATKLALAYLALPPSFTHASTSTSGVINNLAYDAGNVYQGS